MTFKYDDSIRLIYEGTEVLPGESFLNKYNEVIHLIGVQRIADSGIIFNDNPITSIKPFGNGYRKGVYTIDGYRVQTPSGERLAILRALKDGLDIDLDIIEKNDDNKDRSSFKVIYNGNVLPRGKRDTDTYVTALIEIGLERIDKECSDIKLPSGGKEYPILTTTLEYSTHSQAVDGTPYRVITGGRGDTKLNILRAIASRLNLDLQVVEDK